MAMPASEQCLAAFCMLLALGTSEAAAQANCAAMRRIDIGISVAPPNVVHTSPYVALELGYFTKHCIDARIIQFDGGESPAARAAVAQGTALVSTNAVEVGRGVGVQQIWGLAPRLPQAYVVAESIKTLADLKGKRLGATGGGIGSLNWLIGREVLKTAGLTANDAQFIPSATAAGCRLCSPGRSTASRCIRKTSIWPEAKAGAACARSAGRPVARIHVQHLWRRDRLDRARSR